MALSRGPRPAGGAYHDGPLPVTVRAPLVSGVSIASQMWVTAFNTHREAAPKQPIDQRHKHEQDSSTGCERGPTLRPRRQRRRALSHQTNVRTPTGLNGALTTRAEAQVTRLSLLYALLDEARAIGEQHPRAALARWNYSARSVVHVFGDSTGNPEADVILRALRATAYGLTN